GELALRLTSGPRRGERLAAAGDLHLANLVLAVGVGALVAYVPARVPVERRSEAGAQLDVVDGVLFGRRQLEDGLVAVEHPLVAAQPAAAAQARPVLLRRRDALGPGRRRHVQGGQFDAGAAAGADGERAARQVRQRVDVTDLLGAINRDRDDV